MRCPGSEQRHTAEAWASVQLRVGWLVSVACVAHMRGGRGCVMWGCVMYPTESRLQPDVKRFTPQVIASVYCTYSS